MVVSIKIDLREIDDFAKRMLRIDTKLQLEVHEALRIGANLIKTDAMRDCPVRTGFLRSTIYAIVKKIWVFAIGAWAFYAKFQEYGTRYIRARRFVQNAIKRRWSQVRDIVRRAIIISIQEGGRR